MGCKPTKHATIYNPNQVTAFGVDSDHYPTTTDDEGDADTASERRGVPMRPAGDDLARATCRTAFVSSSSPSAGSSGSGTATLRRAATIQTSRAMLSISGIDFSSTHRASFADSLSTLTSSLGAPSSARGGSRPIAEEPDSEMDVNRMVSFVI
jgi:hypothetical protein